jgi:hypothetical protein
MSGSAPTTTLVLGTLLLGLLASLFWPLTQHLITMTHEGSHAMIGSITGGTVRSVRTNFDGTGVTNVPGANIFLTGLMGYAGPSLFGLLGATMLANRVHPNVIIWTSLVLMALILLQIRNVFGWIAVLVTGFVFWMVVHYGTPTGRQVFVYTWVWFLLLGGFVQNVQYNISRHGWSADAGILRDLTRLPRGFWGALWWLTTLAALIYGGGVLFGAVDPLIQVD